MYENNNTCQDYQQPYHADPQQIQPVQTEIQRCADTAFSKGLAATIMAQFPIASIIAIFFGSIAVNNANRAKELAACCNTTAGGNASAGKVLGMIGKITGIVMTVFWGIYFLYFAFIMAMMLGSM